MSKETYSLQQAAGHTTQIYAFLCDEAQLIKGKPLASLLFLRGMAEHYERYLSFASALNNAGIDVYLYNHRGHGKETNLEDLGHIALSGGDELLIEDALQVASLVRKKMRGENYFIAGHSMGSLVTRCVIQQDDSFQGAIICGSTYPNKITTTAGIIVTSLVRLFKGSEHRSPLLNHLLFESKAYLKLSTRTVMDWLTRDDAIVGSYLHDPFCGFVCSASFYRDLIRLTRRAGRSSGMLHTRTELPLLFLSGDHDPVGGYGKQITALAQFYTRHGYTDTTCKLYPEDRHELLNELDRDTVIADLLTWIQSHCKQ